MIKLMLIANPSFQHDRNLVQILPSLLFLSFPSPLPFSPFPSLLWALCELEVLRWLCTEGELCVRKRGQGGNTPGMQRVFQNRKHTVYIACSSREQTVRNLFAKGRASGSLLLRSTGCGKAFAVCCTDAVGPSHRVTSRCAGGSPGVPSDIHSENILLSLSPGVGTHCKAHCSSIQALYLGCSAV